MATKRKPVIIDGKRIGSFGADKNGKERIFLNPVGKARKYVRELKKGYHLKNTGKPVVDKNGNKIPLTEAERMWRAGYISHSSDSAATYNLKKGGKR